MADRWIPWRLCHGQNALRHHAPTVRPQSLSNKQDQKRGIWLVDAAEAYVFLRNPENYFIIDWASVICQVTSRVTLVWEEELHDVAAPLSCAVMEVSWLSEDGSVADVSIA